MSEERYIEQSQAHIDRVVADRASKIKGKVPVPGVTGSSVCVECGDEIQRGRTAIGYSICICCAE